QSGDNPRILESKLVSFLPPDKREAVLAEINAE
ncbi:MAG TPA: motility protein A, partial [Spirochaeta sp.]|nr:motility protein A [Spirochaeta sp.]